MAKIVMIANDIEEVIDMMETRFEGLRLPTPSNEAIRQVYETINEVNKKEAIIDINEITIHEFYSMDVNENIKSASKLLGINLENAMLHGFISEVESMGYEFIHSQYWDNGFILATW